MRRPRPSSAKDGLTITADDVDKTGRKLRGVFIQNRENDVDVVTSAEGGELELTPDKLQIQLRLKNGAVIRDYGAERPSTLRFQDFVLDRKFDLTAPPFRPRGGSERELTLSELWTEMGEPAPSAPYNQLSAEFHSRIARSLSLIFLPLLIVPLSMTMRRNTRIANMVTAAVATVLYHNSLQIGDARRQGRRAGLDHLLDALRGVPRDVGLAVHDLDRPAGRHRDLADGRRDRGRDHEGVPRPQGPRPAGGGLTCGSRAISA
nr:LptF/LptG family permease [Chenggangzhangella methanolivorans]